MFQFFFRPSSRPVRAARFGPPNFDQGLKTRISNKDSRAIKNGCVDISSIYKRIIEDQYFSEFIRDCFAYNSAGFVFIMNGRISFITSFKDRCCGYSMSQDIEHKKCAFIQGSRTQDLIVLKDHQI